MLFRSPDPNEKRRVIEDFEKEEAPIKNESATTEDAEESMEELWDNTVKWNDGNHECLLFSNTTHVVSFLSLDPEKMRQKMHPGLLSHLQQNRINLGEDLDKLSSRFHEVHSALTEVQKTEDEAKQNLDGKYCLTAHVCHFLSDDRPGCQAFNDIFLHQQVYQKNRHNSHRKPGHQDRIIN